MSINLTALKNYAPKARQDFIAAVTARAAMFGIVDGDLVPMQEQGDVVIIGGEAFPKKIGRQRKTLTGRIDLHGFDQIMEGVAYTWFNRFLAIRFMELHGYLDHGYRVLSHPDGGDLPEILEHAEHLDLAGLDMARVVDLKLDGTKDAELYRLLLVAQCNALHDAMPFLFEKIDDETELLLPDNLLHSNSLIRQLVNEIDEFDWQEIEIIGWLYQFYISEKKDQVIGKVVKSEDIPAATQLFTPNWIVKYMVQNSLGHQWMATYPASSLKDGMDYYIEPVDQNLEVQAQLAEITPKELNPEELTLLDPAAGSGHILVEAYDLFKEIYLERGYRLKDIPRLILEKNLYGLDIDDRAAQMAGFALLMKARADDRRILSEPANLNVMAVQSSEGLDAAMIAKHLMPSGRFELVASNDLLPNTLAQPTLALSESGRVDGGSIESLIDLFADAKTFGSLITVPESIQKELPALGQLMEQNPGGDMLRRQMWQHAVEVLRPLVTQGMVLGRQYDCVVANPPYMGGKGMNNLLKKFAKDNFPNAKIDLFACFMDRSLSFVSENGRYSLITMPAWLFLSSYTKLRESLLNECTIASLLHMGRGIFGIDFGSVAFVVQRTSIPSASSRFFRLHKRNFQHIHIPDIAQILLNSLANVSFKFNFDAYRSPEMGTQIPSISMSDGEQIQYLIQPPDFKKIPGSPFSFWLSKKIRDLFSSQPALSDNTKVCAGHQTGDNFLFLRFWHEVAMENIGFRMANRKEALESGLKWFPHKKGGKYRKWYGNCEYLVNWENDGEEIRNHRSSALRNPEYMFKEGVTWSHTSSSGYSARYSEMGWTFNVEGPTLFSDHPYTFLSLLCSKVGSFFMGTLCPDMHFIVGAVNKIPVPNFSTHNIVESSENARACVDLAKKDWDSSELSWSFKQCPMLDPSLRKSTVFAAFRAWASECDINVETMKELEEENNRIFIDAYGLQNELTPDVPEDQITLARADQEQDIQSLISYAIGCMMGRYSLAEEGLIYANSGNEGFDPTRYGDFLADDDGILPITDAEWFGDDATVRFEEFLKIAWSPETLKENLKFVGDSLANNGGNDPLKTIRNYLNKDFYKDHLKTYKKRPIYWLFSSGKQRAFECLVYLHRYNEGTLARMRMEYVTPLQSRMSARIDQLAGDVESASSTPERNRKQKERDKLVKQLEELRDFDEELRHYADQRITLDLDDGVKVNYGKFGNLLAETTAITGKK